MQKYKQTKSLLRFATGFESNLQTNLRLKHRYDKK